MLNVHEHLLQFLPCSKKDEFRLSAGYTQFLVNFIVFVALNPKLDNLYTFGRQFFDFSPDEFFLELTIYMPNLISLYLINGKSICISF